MLGLLFEMCLQHVGENCVHADVGRVCFVHCLRKLASLLIFYLTFLLCFLDLIKAEGGNLARVRPRPFFFFFLRLTGETLRKKSSAGRGGSNWDSLREK